MQAHQKLRGNYCTNPSIQPPCLVFNDLQDINLDAHLIPLDGWNVFRFKTGRVIPTVHIEGVYMGANVASNALIYLSCGASKEWSMNTKCPDLT